MTDLEKTIAENLTGVFKNIGESLIRSKEQPKTDEGITLKSSDGKTVTLTQEAVDNLFVEKNAKPETPANDADAPLTGKQFLDGLASLNANFAKAIEKATETKEDRVRAATAEVNKSMTALLKAQGIDVNSDSVEIIVKEKKRGGGVGDDVDADGVSFRFKSEDGGFTPTQNRDDDGFWPDEKPYKPSDIVKAKQQLSVMKETDSDLYNRSQAIANRDLWKQVLKLPHAVAA